MVQTCSKFLRLFATHVLKSGFLCWGSHRVHKEYIALIDGRLGGEGGPYTGVPWWVLTESCHCRCMGFLPYLTIRVGNPHHRLFTSASHAPSTLVGGFSWLTWLMIQWCSSMQCCNGRLCNLEELDFESKIFKKWVACHISESIPFSACQYNTFFESIVTRWPDLHHGCRWLTCQCSSGRTADHVVCRAVPSFRCCHFDILSVSLQRAWPV